MEEISKALWNGDYSQDSEILAAFKESNHVRVVHIFNKKNAKGGITICYRPALHDSKGNPIGDFGMVSVAYCRATEMYSRKCGERCALHKMYDSQYVTLPIYRNKRPVRTILNIFECL